MGGCEDKQLTKQKQTYLNSPGGSTNENSKGREIHSAWEDQGTLHVRGMQDLNE